MPYIKKEDKEKLFSQCGNIDYSQIKNAGELNFIITMIIKDYFLSRGNYQAANDIIGALEGAKTEFYRRVVAPYENSKIMTNGDVYNTEPELFSKIKPQNNDID